MSPSPDQWAEARAAFEAGESARAVARRIGAHHSAITRQAKRQGWAKHQVGGGGAVAQRRVAARPDAPDDEAPAPPDGPLVGDAEPPLDLTNPAHQRAVLEAYLGIRRGPALEDHLDRLLEDQRQAQAERIDWWRIPF